MFIFVFPTRWLWWGLNPRPFDYQADVLPPDHPICNVVYSYSATRTKDVNRCTQGPAQAPGQGLVETSNTSTPDTYIRRTDRQLDLTTPATHDKDRLKIMSRFVFYVIFNIIVFEY